MFSKDFVDLLRLLREHRVRYLVIGGYAVGVHSNPRTTKDLDILVESSHANASRLLSALDDFGAPVDNISTEDFATPGTLFVFGIPPSRVDILNRIRGARFGPMYERRVSVAVAGVRVDFVSRSDLIRLKKIAGRPQDIADIEALKQSERRMKLPTKRTKRG